MQSAVSIRVNPRSLNQFAVAALRNLIAVSLLLFFLLPNTVWSNLSPAELYILLTAHATHAFDAVVTIVFGIVAPITLFRSSYARTAPAVLRFAAVAYLAPIIYTVGLYVSYPDLSSGAGLILIAFGTGMVAAACCGTSRRIIDVICLLASVQAIYAVYDEAHRINVLQSGDVLRSGGTYGSPNGLYVVMMIVLPLAISSALQFHGTKRHLAYLLCSSVVFSALLLTWDRAGVLATAIGIAWLLFKALPSRATKLCIGIGLGILVTCVCIHRQAGSVNRNSAARSDFSRLLMWQRGTAVFCNNPLIGVGTAALAIPAPTRVRGQAHLIVMGEPKNLLLDWLDELGISGAILLILFVFGIRNKLQGAQGSIEAVAISSSWITILVAGVFDTPFGTWDRYYANALVACLFGATCLLQSKTDEQ